MKLSEAMLLGSTIRKLSPTNWSGCLLGVSVAAIGGGANRFNNEAKERWPWIVNDVEMPEMLKMDFPGIARTSFENSISNLAVKVFTGEVKLDQVIEWVKSVEPTESGKEIIRDQSTVSNLS